MKTIVKVQRSLAPVGNQWLVSDRERKHEDLIDTLPLDARAALGASLKGYFAAKLTHRGWSIGRRVANQTW